MKKNLSLLLLLILSAVMLTSCLDGAENYTPNVYLYGLPVTTQGDTLNITADKDNKAVVDTIYMGDSVRLSIAYESYANNLTAAYVNWDTSMLGMYTTIGEKVLPILKASSDTASLHFDFIDRCGINGFGMNILMLPKKTGKALVSLYVESDAQGLTNNKAVDFYFITDVRPEPKSAKE